MIFMENIKITEEEYKRYLYFKAENESAVIASFTDHDKDVYDNTVKAIRSLIEGVDLRISTFAIHNVTNDLIIESFEDENK